jgi:hypothetical protein
MGRGNKKITHRIVQYGDPSSGKTVFISEEAEEEPPAMPIDQLNNNILIFGKTSTGKSVVLEYMLKEFEANELAKKQAKEANDLKQAKARLKKPRNPKDNPLTNHERRYDLDRKGQSLASSN